MIYKIQLLASRTGIRGKDLTDAQKRQMKKELEATKKGKEVNEADDADKESKDVEKQ